jgi:hypothetical protein
MLKLTPGFLIVLGASGCSSSFSGPPTGNVAGKILLCRDQSRLCTPKFVSHIVVVGPNGRYVLTRVPQLI